MTSTQKLTLQRVMHYGSRVASRQVSSTNNNRGGFMKDPRIGMRCQLHPATDQWMQGDRYGEIVAVSRRIRSYLDPKDPRNGRVFTVLLDRSQKRVRFAEGNVEEIWIKHERTR
jgi:hypothetical protein